MVQNFVVVAIAASEIAPDLLAEIRLTYAAIQLELSSPFT